MNAAMRLAAGATLFSLCALASAATLAVQARDNAGKPLADVVVSVDPEGEAALPKVARPAEIAQRGLAFLPMVSVIQTGSKVSFPNNDKVKHHI